MRQKIRIGCLVLASAMTFDAPATGYVIDVKTGRLVDCGLTMGYMTNLALMRGNEGQARLYIFQYARSMAALFAQNYENGAVSGERTEAWRARSANITRFLDQNEARHAAIIDGCRSVIQEAVDEPRVRSSQMWGKSFNETVEAMAQKSRAQYGLR